MFYVTKATLHAARIPLGFPPVDVAVAPANGSGFASC